MAADHDVEARIQTLGRLLEAAKQGPPHNWDFSNYLVNHAMGIIDELQRQLGEAKSNGFTVVPYSPADRDKIAALQAQLTAMIRERDSLKIYVNKREEGWVTYSDKMESERVQLMAELEHHRIHLDACRIKDQQYREEIARLKDENSEQRKMLEEYGEGKANEILEALNQSRQIAALTAQLDSLRKP